MAPFRPVNATGLLFALLLLVVSSFEPIQPTGTLLGWTGLAATHPPDEGREECQLDHFVAVWTFKGHWLHSMPKQLSLCQGEIVQATRS